MMRRTAILCCTLAIVAAGCGNLGRATAACTELGEDPPNSIVMEIQAVPTAEWGPCLNDLKVGWEYEHLEPESGAARFWLDSDRLGDRFLEVALLDSCEPTGIRAVTSPRPGIDVFVDEAAAPQPVSVTLVPVAERHQSYGADIGVSLSGTTLEGRDLRLEMDTSARTAPERVTAALERGHYVLVFDDLDVLNRTVELRIPAEPKMYPAISVEEALDEIEDRLTELRYRASWFHVFEGGCIVYEYDASGPETRTVVEDVQQAVGFFPLGELRRGAASQGIVINPADVSGE